MEDAGRYPHRDAAAARRLPGEVPRFDGEPQANHARRGARPDDFASAPNQYFFKGDLLNIDKSATATDWTGPPDGVPNSNLTSYTGTGGPCGNNITWETAFGTSAPGVVFV